MAPPLLMTKLHVPPPRPGLVSRPRLIQRLDEGLRLGRRLTLISAPPGFGKSTLVGEWIGGGERPIAWLSLDEGDNDPVQFVRYLIAALQQVDERIGQTIHDVLQSPRLPPLQSLLTPLINDIAAASAALTLVLDDFHLVTAASVHQIVQFLLTKQPTSLHVVICTREDPPLPLAQLRARGLLTEIRERDLRFVEEEAAAFLHRTMGLRLSPEAVAALEARTEGWIAGLQLAALALQDNPTDTEVFIAAFAGDDRHIFDYLVAEVLDLQPEPVRWFLRQTAILDRLTAPLCDALTGREDSQALLEQLDAANLFLIPLDHRREWYRYHRLFAEVLRTTLDRAEQKLLHRRAAYWYEAHGLLSEAIQHALAYGAASGELDDAERLIRLAAEGTLHAGGVLTVRGWLDALPDERVRADGELATFKGWALALSGEITPAEEYADAADTCLRQAEAPATHLDKLLLLRAFIAIGRQDYEHAAEFATGALQMLGKDRPRWRIIALWALAEAQERSRSIADAIATLREAERTGRALGNQFFAALIEAFLAAAVNHHGQRREAVGICEQAIGRYTDQTGRSLPAAALIFSRLGMLCYEANQLEPARSHAERGLALSEQLPARSPASLCLGILAAVQHAQGETGAALEALRHAYQLAAQEPLVDASWLLAWDVNIRLQQGDLASALRWAGTAGLSPDDTPEYLRGDEHLAYARLLLAQGRLDDAQRWLARLERFTQERGLFRWLISVQILQALAADQSSDRSAARDCLAQALQLAAPEGYFRAFLDEDPRVIGLLPDVRHAAQAFVDQLLAYAGVPAPRRDLAPQPLIEPLSDRELEVLGLIAAGLSNDQIAHKLFIAPGTVKRHINNIYGKLDVASRTQAIAKATALRLLRADA